MSRYIHFDSFTAPTGGINYSDGRHLADAAIRKAHRSPQPRPDLLAKKRQSDTALNFAMAKKLTRAERLLRSNQHEALEAIHKIHGKGHVSGVPAHEARGDAPLVLKSVEAMRKARKRVLTVTGHRLPSVQEISNAFSAPARSRVARSVNTGRFTVDFDANGIVLAKRLNARYRKTFASQVNALAPYGAPESRNSVSGGDTADTGAANIWHDSVPSQRPKVIGSQNTIKPDMSDRDAAVEAIKRALRKPQPLSAMRAGGSDLDEDTDTDTEDLDDMDDDEDEDETVTTAQNPNRADAFDSNPNKKRKACRADEDEDGE
jgi:hypothetical protein